MAFNTEKSMDLILQYLHNQLNAEEKLNFYHLLQTDATFRTHFAAEWKLYKELQLYKRKMPAKQKEQILNSILARAEPQRGREKIIHQFVQQLWAMILPEPVVPLIINFAKELSVSE
ncbi:MAG: hypothetical protein GX197_06185 [Firmicutes bacterium]|nr:hypothetical protein [Bacillota bacterium]